MKMKSLVIGDQHAPVNCYSSFVHTARHALEVDQIENEKVRHFVEFTFVNLGSVTRVKS